MIHVYLAGPDVFHPDAVALGRRKKAICEEFGLTGVYPLDNDLPLDGLSPHDQGMTIYRANIALMDGCDAAIANMTPFRGPSCDAGTAFEIGYMRALGRPVFAYSNVAAAFTERSAGLDGYAVERFDMTDNLMLDGAVADSGSQPITGDAADPFTDLSVFRRCVEALRDALAR
ncbi:MAG: nucleoside 2-deoxyribosyltransferase [Alphaproteobacteria bacterium]|nr:nucleoside 2-deoxyribosyltransferase [Alphaproteobacteria bacterium]MBO6864740.1 nucleoside 2-deoxyribosyltransferase [Alphaproteobacteria bacterium]